MNRFERTLVYYRCLCEETGEEQTFKTEKLARAWSQKVVDTFDDKQMTFTLIRIVEESRRYTRDRFAREGYVSLKDV